LREGDHIAEEDVWREAGLAQDSRSSHPDIIWEVASSAGEVDGSCHLRSEWEVQARVL
jgi:hypothetical protein